MEPEQAPSNPSITIANSSEPISYPPSSQQTEDAFLSSLSHNLSSHHKENGSFREDHIDDEDEVVREIDVYISPELASDMSLIQFPLQPASHTRVDNGKARISLPESARIKPQHSMLELEYNIPKAFSTSRQVPEVLNLSKRTFSSQNVTIGSHMAIGLFDSTGTKVDLVPLNKIYQMRPTFSHVDALFDDEDLEARRKEEEIEKQKEKPILYQKQANERQMMAQRSSYAFKKASEDSEQWKTLEVYGHGSIERKEAIIKAHCPHSCRDTDLVFEKAGATPTIGYVKSLNYLPHQDVSGFAEEDFIVPIGEDMEDMSIDDQPDWKRELASRIATILQRKGGVPFSYAVMRSRFNASVTDAILIEALSASAVMIRGNFILKSSLIAFNSQHVADARDLILLLLNKNGFVQREKLIKVYESLGEDDPASIVVTPSAITAILQMVAKKAVNGMEPKIDDNVEFLTTFGPLMTLHADYWERKEVALQRYMDMYENLDSNMDISM